jgi:pyruvate,water dikinase
MSLVITLSEITDQEKPHVGGKAYALSRLHQRGITVPTSICVVTEAYRKYVSGNGLKERIMLDMTRKEFDDMRWEEIWDLALRIRNLFLTTGINEELRAELYDSISHHFGSESVVVRSSAPGEDSETSSFAGLHESFVNIKGIDSIIDHIRLVWASLWSNRALLYKSGLHSGQTALCCTGRNLL